MQRGFSKRKRKELECSDNAHNGSRVNASGVFKVTYEFAVDCELYNSFFHVNEGVEHKKRPK